MTEQQIRNAYCRIRENDHVIPDDVLDFMLQASLEKLEDFSELAISTKVVNIDKNYGEIRL